MKTNIIVHNEEYSGITPLQCGFENCEQGHFFGPAIRTYWLIHFVESGKGIFRINNKEYAVKTGEMFVIPPFVETYYEADSKNPWQYIWVGFTADNLPVKLDDVIFCQDAHTIFSAIKTAERYQSGRSAFITAKLWELFALLLDKNTYKLDYVETAINIIHSEYATPLTINDIANRIGLDRRYFSTLFKKDLGVSPKKALLNYRMEIASILLTEQSSSVSLAAYSVGYSDIFQFSKFFKKHFGVTPTEYKKQI